MYARIVIGMAMSLVIVGAGAFPASAAERAEGGDPPCGITKHHQLRDMWLINNCTPQTNREYKLVLLDGRKHYDCMHARTWGGVTARSAEWTGIRCS